MKEHPCPSCPPAIQKTCAETASFPCEERMRVTDEQVAEAPHPPDVDEEAEAYEKSLEIEELGRW